MDQVARSFMVSEQAMAKRLVRAKYETKAAKIPYRVPTRPTCLLGSSRSCLNVFCDQCRFDFGVPVRRGHAGVVSRREASRHTAVTRSAFSG